MAVYVDDMWRVPMGRLGRMKMSHMIADTTEELLAMAARIGVARKHLQDAGLPSEHFDICLNRRTLAVQAGAIEITMRQCVRMTMHRRAHGTLPKVVPVQPVATENQGGQSPSD